MEHESTTTIPVSPDRLYHAIAEVGNLTRFIPSLKSVKRADSEHLDVTAEYEGHEEHGRAWFRTDDEARRVEWGSDEHPYSGWMQVDPDGEDSKLTLHLNTPHADEIREYVAKTFEAIRNYF
jgi:ribosome-associated toxin RatA of RatAB toxin-antitoxin module